MKKFWCHACGAYGQYTCEKAGHRSEELWFDGSKWKQYKPAKLTEARFSDGSVTHVEVK